MTLVGGFPFILPELHTVVIAMPFWDVNNKCVKWKNFNDTYFTCPQTGQDGFQSTVAKWAWLNKANPDWLLVTPATFFPFTALQGEDWIPLKDVRGATIHVTGGVDKVDKWWGSNKIGKYGCVAYTQEGVPVMPYRWVNSDYCAFENTDIGSDGFYYNFPKGIIADLLLTSASNNGTQQHTIPPVYYWGEETMGWYGTEIDEPTGHLALNYIP